MRRGGGRGEGRGEGGGWKSERAGTCIYIGGSGMREMGEGRGGGEGEGGMKNEVVSVCRCLI